MALWQGRSKRKFTGGRYKSGRGKKRYEIGGETIYVHIGPEKRKTVRTQGGNVKTKLQMAEYVNVYNPKDSKSSKVRVISVRQNPSNPNYVQRNIINRGAIIQTEVGLVKVTSRPTQDGVLNGVLVE